MAEHLHHCTMFFGAQSAQITSEPVWNPGTGLNLRTSWNKFKSGSLFSIFEPPGIGGRKSIGLAIASSRTISESIWVYLLGFHIGNLVNKWESTQLGKHQGYLWVHSSTNGELISWTGKLCFPLFTFGILWSHDSSCRTDAKVFHFNCSQETNYPTGESRRHYPNEIQRGMGMLPAHGHSQKSEMSRLSFPVQTSLPFPTARQINLQTQHKLCEV